MEWVRLGDIADIKAGGTPSRSNKEYWDNGKIPWAKISDFNGKFLDKTEEFINENGIENSSAKLFKAGTILYSIFATIGEATILSIDSSTNQAIAGIDVNEDLALKEYVYYYLLSIKDEVIAKSRGVAQNNINLSILRNFEILLPDKKTQKSIIECLSVAEKLIKIRQDQIQALDDLLESSFYQMLDENDVSYVSLEDLIEKKPKKISNKNTEPISYFDISSINNESNTISQENIILDAKDRPSRARQIIMHDDVLLSTVRPNLKNIAYFNYDHTYQAIASTGFAVLRAKKDLLNPKYLFYLVLSDEYTKKLISISTGASYPAVKESDVRNLKIPVIEIEKQNKFANLVTRVEGQKGILEDSLSELSDLFASLMQDAFDGSLGK